MTGREISLTRMFCLYRFSNYEAANMLVGTNSVRLVQRLRRAFRSVI